MLSFYKKMNCTEQLDFTHGWYVKLQTCRKTWKGPNICSTLCQPHEVHKKHVLKVVVKFLLYFFLSKLLVPANNFLKNFRIYPW